MTIKMGQRTSQTKYSCVIADRMEATKRALKYVRARVKIYFVRRASASGRGGGEEGRAGGEGGIALLASFPDCSTIPILLIDILL